MSQSSTSAPFKVSNRRLLKKIAVRIIAGLSITICFLICAGFAWVWWGGENFSSKERCCAPGNLAAVSATRVVNLHWTPVPNAIFYQIDKSDTPQGPYWLAGSPYGYMPLPHRWPVFFERFFYRVMNTSISGFGRVPYPHFTDTVDPTNSLHYYRVRAFLGDWWTPWTSPVSIQVADGTASTVDIAIDADQSVGLFQQKWDPIGMEYLGYIVDDKGIPRQHGGGILQHALATAHQQLGFQYVIAHGVFLSDLGVVSPDKSTLRSYRWERVDIAYDKILSAGLKPVVQLGFMPSELALHPRQDSIWSYHGIASPPANYQDWADLVHALAVHLEARYGASRVRSWAFDVWNEPDVCVPGKVCYWHGSDEDYFKLYDSSVEALRSVDPLLRVGGPVAMDPTFINTFLRHVADHHYTFRSSPLDFLDTRVYDAPVENWRPLLEKYNLGQAQIWYTEWGLHNFGSTDVTDSVFSAPWIANMFLDSFNYADHIGFWNVSDDSVEHSTPSGIFHGGFGLVGLYEVPKPSYWAYYMLNKMGHTKLAVVTTPSEGSELVRSLATTDSNHALQILLSNATKDQWQKAGDPHLDRDVVLSVKDLIPRKSYALRIYRIDAQHTNVLAAWHQMGSPAWPTAEQLAKLKAASQLQLLATATSISTDSSGSLSLNVPSPMPSLSLVMLTPADAVQPR